MTYAHLDSHDPRNYTLGCSSLVVGGVNLGNVVSAVISMPVERVSRFDALLGREVEDPRCVRLGRLAIKATIDEPNKANVYKFFLADSNGKIGFGISSTPVSVTFDTIPMAGNHISWTIPKAIVLPDGDLSYSDQEWLTLGLNITAIWDATNGYGSWTHDGVLV